MQAGPGETLPTAGLRVASLSLKHGDISGYGSC